MPGQPRNGGAVNEILPADKLLPRAREIAEGLAKPPPLTTRYTHRTDAETAAHH
jgi:enoyl-CoA hydratase/carnithine racemase